MSEKRFTEVEVLAWLVAIREDIDHLKTRLTPLIEEQRRLEAREALLTGLLGSFGVAADAEGNLETNPIQAPHRTGSTASYVVKKTAEILLDEGQPLHINDIHTKFLERGFAVPGAGKAANLIVHIRKSDEIASPRRGIYGLAEQVGSVSKPARPKRRRTTKRRHTRTGANSGSS